MSEPRYPATILPGTGFGLWHELPIEQDHPGVSVRLRALLEKHDGMWVSVTSNPTHHERWFKEGAVRLVLPVSLWTAAGVASFVCDLVNFVGPQVMRLLPEDEVGNPRMGMWF